MVVQGGPAHAADLRRSSRTGRGVEYPRCSHEQKDYPPHRCRRNLSPDEKARRSQLVWLMRWRWFRAGIRAALVILLRRIIIPNLSEPHVRRCRVADALIEKTVAPG